MSAEILMAVAEANLAAGAAICAVLAVRKPIRRLFGARIAYGLWLTAPLAAAASLLPARTIIIPYVAATAAPEAAVDIVALPAVTHVVDASPLFSGDTVMALWLVGAAVSFAVLAWSQSRFMKSLGGVVREGKFLRAGAAGAGPAVLGAFFPRIVLPADFETRYDAREQTVVLAHEAAHLASGDAAVNAMMALTQCLFWFNPLIHIAARIVRVDQELACDAAVLAAYPGERRPYAEALLKTQIAATPLPLGCYWPAGASNPLKERIAMLKLQTPSRARRLGGGAGVLALCLGAGFAAWAAQPAQLIEAPTPHLFKTRSSANLPGIVETRVAAADLAPAATRPMDVVERPSAESAVSADVRASTVVSPDGRSFRRINAAPPPPPPPPPPLRFETLMVINPNGTRGTKIIPQVYQAFPLPPYPGISDEWTVGPQPTEAVRAASLIIEIAKADQANRVAAGSLPQPYTPELAEAFRVISEYNREAIRQSQEELRPRLAASTARMRLEDPTGAITVQRAITATNNVEMAMKAALSILERRIESEPTAELREALIKSREELLKRQPNVMSATTPSGTVKVSVSPNGQAIDMRASSSFVGQVKVDGQTISVKGKP